MTLKEKLLFDLNFENYHNHLTENKRIKQMNKQNRNTHEYGEQTGGYHRGGEGRMTMEQKATILF